MIIEMWTDISCPYCYMGKKRLLKVIDKLAFKDEIKIVYRSYQLRPELKPKKYKSTYEYISKKNKITIEEAKERTLVTKKRARSFGLTYNYDKMIPVNTNKCHRVLHLAKKYDKDLELCDLFYKSYYTLGKDLNDDLVLANLASKVGITKEEVLNMLETDEYIINVKNDMEEVFTYKEFEGIPFFLINGKMSICGLESANTYKSILEKEELES